MLINQDQRRLENQFVQYKKAIFFEVGDNFSKKKQNPFNHSSREEQDIEPLLKQS